MSKVGSLQERLSWGKKMGGNGERKRKWRERDKIERESLPISLPQILHPISPSSRLSGMGDVSLSSLPAYNMLCYPMLEIQAHLKIIQTKYYISQRLTRSGAPFPCWCDVVGSVSESSSTTWFSLGGRGFNCDQPVGIVKPLWICFVLTFYRKEE